ncbi:1-phosphofructokinase [Sporosarcina koreensis]|uniref:1-phosphofructokinase n=1 Tax=Sporosarcina koreensis TaxID=334735 RepID=UPI00058EB04B|nr:1-phosphofructokinase [Sporosarcina koreensis]
MIYTVTLNPSLDYLLSFDSLAAGSLNRAAEARYLPGGKGNNVAQVLTSLGGDATALGFTGGFTGRELERLLAHSGVRSDFIHVDGDTRVNVKIRAGQETEINAAGPAISELQFRKLADQVRGMAAGDVLVLSGSIPASLPADAYEQLADICRTAGCRFTVDAEGSALRKTLKYRPLLVKPNHHELAALIGTAIRTKEEAALHARTLIDEGAEQVIVSLAGEGAVYVSAEETYLANAPAGRVRGSVGAGDSMVAGFLAATAAGKSAAEAFRAGIAAGSATAFSDRLCTAEEAAALIPRITVTQFEGGDRK